MALAGIRFRFHKSVASGTYMSLTGFRVAFRTEMGKIGFAG